MKRSSAASATLLLLLSACSDGGTQPGPPERVPTRLELTPQSVAVDDGGSARLTAILRDQDGEAFATLPAGISIAWSSSAADVASVVDGMVTGQHPGEARIIAQAAGLRAEAGVQVRPVARQIETAAGSGQQGTAGAPLPEPVVVRVVDRHGNGVGGVAVEWAVTGGGGSLAPTSGATDAQGYARATWTLGTAAGANSAQARAAGLTGSPVEFGATGGAGPAARVFKGSGDGQTATVGTTLPAPLVVRVVDTAGNPVAGASVTWGAADGGGFLTPMIATTDAAGEAVSAWTLGRQAGANSATATVGGGTVGFTATAVAGAPAKLLRVAGDAQSGGVGTPLPDSLVVRVTDTFDNPTAGIAVAWSASSGGATSPASSSTDAGGFARSRWTLGPTAGAQTASAAVQGLTPVAFGATATQAPSAVTGSATGVQTGSATLNGQVDPHGSATAAWFEWGTSATLAGASSTAQQSVGAGTGAVAVSADLQGLVAGTQYYYRVVASSAAGRSAGAIGSFVTLSPPPPPPPPTPVRIVTFGDSNTDYGYRDRASSPEVSSYVSWRNTVRLGPTDPNSPLQLAGKIEARWPAIRPEIAISAVNHGIGSTSSGAGRASTSSPNARTLVNGTSRFAAEVLGRGAPWHGGETDNEYFDGPITRVQAFIPGPDDFAYISIGTNDATFGISPSGTIANLTWMVDQWTGAGLPASHLIVTTLAPRDGDRDAGFPQINEGIRALGRDRGIHVIDLAGFTSDDDGLTWKSSTLHVQGDANHYAEAVRAWLADEVVGYMAAQVP